MNRVRCTWFLLSLLSVASAGCCCVQGVSSCGSCDFGGGGFACDTGCGTCGPGPVANLASCRGACGEVYVDEWISEPPTIDNCGYDCGGCGHCGQCRPVRNLLRLLWGRPFVTSCSTGLCGPSCDGGCGVGAVEHGSGGSGCNCGQDHSVGEEVYHSDPIQMHGSPSYTPPSAPMNVSPEAVPTPAPAITPSSAKRLNPAKQRQAVSSASATRR